VKTQSARISVVILGLAVLLGGLVPRAASAALRLVYERKHDGAVSENVMTFDNQLMRIDGMPGPKAGPESAGNELNAMIMDPGAHKMIILFPAKKSYSEISQAQMQQAQEQMKAMQAQMAERMKSMPPEQRKMMEQMMAKNGAALGGTASPKLKYTALGEKKKVAGFPCEMYSVSFGDRVVAHNCFALWGSNVLTKADVEQLKKLAMEMKDMFGSTGNAPAFDWSQVPGVPVEETHFGPDGKTVAWVNTLKSVNHGAVPASLFEIPASYTKQESPMGQMRGPHGPHGRPPAGP
jgi:hypothetical protein